VEPYMSDRAATMSRDMDPMRALPDDPAGPVIILSYPYSGADLVQRILTRQSDLAPTAGTGIVPMCEAVAAIWTHIDGRPGAALSPLAVTSIRVLVTTQLTVALASAGQRRWCELATAAPSAAQTFLRIFPAARCVCVYRACTGVISAAVTAQPWGLAGSAMSLYTASYPGNSVAAAAAYWASATEQLLAFEAANPRAAVRVRYEDVVADAEHALENVRTFLCLDRQIRHELPPGFAEPAAEDARSGYPQVPLEMIPAELRKRIELLHERLSYPAG
jgi:hypothetical protein